MSDTKTITILKSTVCGGRPVQPGEVVDASSSDAFYLLATKAATTGGQLVENEEKPRRGKKKAPINRMIDQEELEDRDPGE